MSIVDFFWFIVTYLDLLFYIAFPVLIAAWAGWFVLKKIEETEIEKITGHLAERVHRLGMVLVGRGWLEEHQFEWIGCYRIVIPNVKMRFSAWKQVGSNTYLCVYRVKAVNLPGKTNVDIVSIFGRRYGLTTAGSDDGPMFPVMPGVYKQYFETRDISHLWSLHTQAEALIAPTDLTRIDPIDKVAFEDMLARAIKDELDFIRSILLWQLRVPWWYFVNRPRHLNKTVLERMGRRERKRLGIR